MIMANNSSTSNNLLTGDIKKEILNAVSSSSSSSSLSVSQTVLSSSTSSQSSANTTTTTSEVKIESVMVSSHTSQQTATKAVSSGNAPIIVNSDSRWIFPLEKIEQSPSRLDGIGKESELSERQEAALFINDLGTKLKVNQLCINTAIIYMHRFYMIHSLKKFHHYVRIVATSCLFFACKVEEQPRRLREFIDIVQSLFHKSNEPINHNSEEYKHYGDQIMALESSLIQTLGFNVLINHAHTVIIKTCQMIKAPRDLAEAAYLTATNSLILTDFCVKFSSERVACFCIYLACKWTGLIIPMSSEGLQWYEYVNHDIKEQELEDISKEYLAIYDKCSAKIKRKLGITKNQDEINSQLQPKNGQQQVRKPTSSQQYPNRPTNQSQNQNKQYPNPQHGQHQHPKAHPGLPQQNGYHPNSASSQPASNQQYPPHKQQHYPQQQRPSNPNLTPNKQQPGTQASTHSSHSHFSNNNNKNHNPNSVQPSPKTNTNPSSANFNNSNNRSNFPNGTSSGSSSYPSHPSHNLNNQTGASSSMNTKSFNNLNSGNGEGATNFNNNNKNMNTNHLISNNNNNNGQSSNNYQIKKPNQNQIKPEQMNNSANYKQMNGTNNNNTSLNMSNSRSSPSGQLNSSSMKRGNEEIGSSNVTTAPNKIPKYVIDQKSAS